MMMHREPSDGVIEAAGVSCQGVVLQSLDRVSCRALLSDGRLVWIQLDLDMRSSARALRSALPQRWAVRRSVARFNSTEAAPLGTAYDKVRDESQAERDSDFSRNPSSHTAPGLPFRARPFAKVCSRGKCASACPAMISKRGERGNAGRALCAAAGD